MATRTNTPGRRILRIGVLLGGKIIEERLVRERASVTIGQSAKNMFSIPLETLPRDWTLFSLEGSGYELRFSGKMDGRISDGGQLSTLEQLKGARAQQRGDAWTLPLTDQARGKIAVGELTVLFQFVAEPPLQPKPMLPASVRGSFSERIEPRLAVIVSGSLLAHFALLAAAMLHDPPKKRGGWGRRAAVTQQVNVIDPMPEPTPPPQEDPEAGKEKDEGKEEPAKDEPKKPSDKPRDDKPAAVEPADKKPAGGGDPAAEAAAREARKAELQAEAARYAAALASDGESSDGTGIDGQMGDRAPGGDLNAQIREVGKSGAEVRVGGRDGGPRGQGGEPRVGTGDGPEVAGPAIVKDSAPKPKVPKPDINIGGAKAEDDTTLDPSAVDRKIKSTYLASLSRCYSDLLKSDDKARGRVELVFTVNEGGRVTSPSVKSDYESLSSCIKGRMSSWTFPAPKDEDGEPTTATFKFTLALSPG